jgi:hypothetical protein
MKCLIHSVAAILAAFLALLLLTGAVHSAPSADHAEGMSVRSDDYAYTRLTTITVGSSTDPLTSGLNSRWQIQTISHSVFGVYEIPLPDDAYEISVALPADQYRIDPGPTLIITGPQPDLYFEYRTNQRALRLGNQVLITQTSSNNQRYRYRATLTFTNPYQHVGTSGFAPTETATTLYWDVVPELGADARYRFNASTWLVHPSIPLNSRPDLEIIAASLSSQMDHAYVTATIRNSGFTMTVAPAYLNLYDRPSPSVTPTGPLDLVGGWCSSGPLSSCGGGDRNPLPALVPGDAVVFTATFDLTATGQHDIYLFVDALGGSQGQGLNVESVESNNSRRAGSLMKWSNSVFLPLIVRN